MAKSPPKPNGTADTKHSLHDDDADDVVLPMPIQGEPVKHTSHYSTAAEGADDDYDSLRAGWNSIELWNKIQIISGLSFLLGMFVANIAAYGEGMSEDRLVECGEVGDYVLVCGFACFTLLGDAGWLLYMYLHNPHLTMDTHKRVRISAGIAAAVALVLIVLAFVSAAWLNKGRCAARYTARDVAIADVVFTFFFVVVGLFTVCIKKAPPVNVSV